MKKRIELSEVKKQILSGLAEFQEDHVDYYLHVSEDGDIVSDVAHADESLIYSVPYERYGFGVEDIEADQCNDFCTIKDAIYAHEVDGDDIFEEIVENLCTQANKWLEEQEEGKARFKQLLDTV